MGAAAKITLLLAMVAIVLGAQLLERELSARRGALLAARKSGLAIGAGRAPLDKLTAPESRRKVDTAMPSKKLWGYIAKLEKAIKEVMESSPEIAELVEKIQGEGVEVSLNCIALFSDTKGRSFTSPAGKITRDGHKR